MKATIELPEPLYREVKLRAVQEGRKLKDVFTELLRRGLESSEAGEVRQPKAKIGKSPVTGLQVVLADKKLAKGKPLSSDEIAEVLLQQDIERLREAS